MVATILSETSQNAKMAEDTSPFGPMKQGTEKCEKRLPKAGFNSFRTICDCRAAGQTFFPWAHWFSLPMPFPLSLSERLLYSALPVGSGVTWQPTSTRVAGSDPTNAFFADNSPNCAHESPTVCARCANGVCCAPEVAEGFWNFPAGSALEPAAPRGHGTWVPLFGEMEETFIRFQCPSLSSGKTQ